MKQSTPSDGGRAALRDFSSPRLSPKISICYEAIQSGPSNYVRRLAVTVEPPHELNFNARCTAYLSDNQSPNWDNEAEQPAGNRRVEG